MLISVRIAKETVSVSIHHNQTVLELKNELCRLKAISGACPYWLTYHGLVLLDDMMISEIGFLEGTEIVCSESLTSSVVIPTAKGNEVWRVILQPSPTPGTSMGQVLPVHSPSMDSSKSREWYNYVPVKATFPSLDLNTIVSCAGMMWSFWMLSSSFSKEMSAFKENKTFSEIAKSMVNGSIEGLLDNMSLIKNLLSTKLG